MKITIIDDYDFVRFFDERKYEAYNQATHRLMSQQTFANAFVLLFDPDEQKYYLEKYRVYLDEATKSIARKEAREIVSIFDMNNQSLQTVIEFDPRTYGSYSKISPAVFLFCKTILANHKNHLAGNNVYNMIFANKKSVTYIAYSNIIKYYDDIEAIEKLGKDFINLIFDDNFKIDKTGDRHKIIGLPKQVITFVDEIIKNERAFEGDRSELIDDFKKLCANNSSEALVVLEYLNLQNKVSELIPMKNSAYCGHVANGRIPDFIHYVANIYSEFNIRVKKMINYVVKQQANNMFFVHYGTGRGDPIRFMLGIPCDVIRTYYDYLKMNPIDLFPKDLFKSHNVLAAERKIIFSDEEKELFSEYGRKIAAKYNMNVKGYTFRVPDNYDKFIEDGKNFMNCLPLCGPSFMKGLCDIVFVYNGDLNEFPDYALEIKNGMIIQAKGQRDLDVTDMKALEAITSYEEKIAERN